MILTEDIKFDIATSSHDILDELLDICIDALGVVDIEEAMETTKLSRARIYQLMKPETTFKIGKHKFIKIAKL